MGIVPRVPVPRVPSPGSDAESNHVSAKVCNLSHVFAHACRKGALHVEHWVSPLWAVCPCMSLHTEQSALLLSHGAAQPSHLILPQSHWSDSIRQVHLMGSQVVQWHPVHVPYLLKVLIHFCAGVGASAPARTMPCGSSGATPSSWLMYSMDRPRGVQRDPARPVPVGVARAGPWHYLWYHPEEPSATRLA